METWKRGDINPATNMVFVNYKSNGKLQWSSIESWNKRKLRVQKHNESDKGKLYQKNWYIQNKEQHLKDSKKSVEKRKEESPLKLLFTSIKCGAKKRKIEFDINVDYVLELWNKQQGLCYYTNIPMKYIAYNKDPFQVSIDRIDSSKGYFKDNVVLCCQSINFMKNNYSIDIFYEFLNKLFELNGKIRVS